MDLQIAFQHSVFCEYLVRQSLASCSSKHNVLPSSLNRV